MRLRGLSVLLVAALLVVACNGDDPPATAPTPTPGPATPVPTAAPYSQVPRPIVVSGGGLPSAPSTATETAVTYVVEPGDTVGGIAIRFGVTNDVIRDANNLDGDNIFVGQTLTIPRGSATAGGTTGGTTGGGVTGSPGTGAPAPTPAPPAGSFTYTIEEGDTAFGLALRFDVTVEQLEAANGVGPGGLDALQIGQVIIIPR